MDIICARCGKHFNSIEACRGHHCQSNDARPSFKLARNTRLSDAEWKEIERYFNISKPEKNPDKPLVAELEIGFPKLDLASIPSTRTVKEPMTVFSWVVIAIFLLVGLGIISVVAWGIYLLVNHF